MCVWGRGVVREEDLLRTAQGLKEFEETPCMAGLGWESSRR